MLINLSKYLEPDANFTAHVLITLINANTSLFIRNKAFVKLMKKLFLETYKNAPEIKI